MTKPSKTSAAGASAVEVAENVDILTEILLRLPVRSLVIFKAVSKRWLYLISEPEFSRRRGLSPTVATGLFLYRPESADIDAPEFDFIDLRNPSPHQSTSLLRDHSLDPDTKRDTVTRLWNRSLSRVTILQSCNGLLLCWARKESTFHVINPATKQYKALPPTPESSLGVALAFDPSVSPRYEAVCVTNSSGDPSQFQISISSDAGPWRPSILGPFVAGFDALFNEGVFCDGAVHWISPWGPSLRFHVAEERMLEMPMPPVPSALEGIDRSFRYFAASSHHLYFADNLLAPGETRLSVYEMERGCSGWFVKYTIDLSELAKVFPEMIVGSEPGADPFPDEYHLSMLCVVSGEDNEDSFAVVNVPGKILRYDFKSGAFRELGDVVIQDVSEMVMEAPEAYQYIESLACVWN